MSQTAVVEVVLVAGVSGAGKSVALGALEDSRYFAVQNLPPVLLPQLVEELMRAGFDRCAVSFDMRLADQFTQLPELIAKLKASGVAIRVLVLEAKDDTLIRRFSETRRHHTLAEQQGITLEEAIRYEREQLLPFIDMATRVDTSGLSSHALRSWVRLWTHTSAQSTDKMSLVFESFGYKYGVPLDADLVFDARMLPNPHYETGLRALTGRDKPVADFLAPNAEVKRFIADVEAFLRKWLAAYGHDNRATLTVAIGCTGGQHRSVYCVEQLAQLFAPQVSVLIRHRQLPTL